jgi:glycine betaine/choline ABC-type transport system substrate-binding protein
MHSSFAGSSPRSPELTTATVTDLDKKVDADGMTPQDVAKTWMKQNGFIR